MAAPQGPFWAILTDKGRLYFPRTWEKKKDAEKELVAMLQGYPRKSPWRKYLSVGPWKEHLPPGDVTRREEKAEREKKERKSA